MERTIRVTGKGNLLVKPDQIRLIMELEGSEFSYEDTLKLSVKKVEDLKDVFEKLGFERKELKTTYFNVDTKYESYQAKDKSWKRRFEGYEFKHNLKIEFDADNEVLGRVLYALSHSPVAPEFRIVYTVKDMETTKNKLLAKAVADSKEKATVLTTAAGVHLGDILTIDYSWGEVEFTTSPMSKLMEPMELSERCMSAASYDMDIEPDDIDVTDTVTVVWSIK